MLRVVVFLLGLFVSSQAFLVVPTARRNVTRILTVDNGDVWGDWHQPEFCAKGTYAAGYEMKIEGTQGSGDDTSLNAVKLFCEGVDATGFGGTVMSGEGPWGTWGGKTSCDPQLAANHFIVAFDLQVEPPQGGNTDDTGANFIRFKCREFGAQSHEYEIAHAPNHGFWGSYGSWSSTCPVGSAVCGIQVRLEPNQRGGDDTTLNDVKLFCCHD